MALGSARGESESLHPERDESAGGARPDQIESQEAQPAEAELENASGFSILSQPPAGSVTNNGDGTFSFNPGTDFADLGIGASRTVNFTFLLAGSEVVSATVTVTGTSDGPIATDVVYNSLGAPESEAPAGDAAPQADPIAPSEEPLLGSADPREVDDLGDLAFSADPAPEDSAAPETERKPLSELSVSELLSPEPESPEPAVPEATAPETQSPETQSPETHAPDSPGPSPEPAFADAGSPDQTEPAAETSLWGDSATADEGAPEPADPFASTAEPSAEQAPVAPTEPDPLAEAAPIEASSEAAEPASVDQTPASPPDGFDPWADWDKPAEPDPHGGSAPDPLGGPDLLGAQADAPQQETDPAPAGDAWAPAAPEASETPAEEPGPADDTLFGDSFAPDAGAAQESSEASGGLFGSPAEPVADPPAEAPEAEDQPAEAADSFFDAFPAEPAAPQPESQAPAAESGEETDGDGDLWGDVSAPTVSDDWADLAGELADPSPDAVAAVTAPDSQQPLDVAAPEAATPLAEPIDPEPIDPDPIEPNPVEPAPAETASIETADPGAAGCIVSQPSAGRAIDNGDGTFDFDPGDDFDDLQQGETRQVTFDVRLPNGDDYRATVTVADDGAGPFARDVDFERQGGAAPAAAPGEALEAPLTESAAAPAAPAPEAAEDPWAEFNSGSAPEAEQPLAETPQGFADIGEDALQQEMTEEAAPAQAPDPLAEESDFGSSFGGDFWGEETGPADTAADLPPLSEEPAPAPGDDFAAAEMPAPEAPALDAPVPEAPGAAAPAPAAPNLDALPRLIPDSPPSQAAPAAEAAPLGSPDGRPDTLQLSGVTAGPGAGGWDIQLTTGEILEDRPGCVVLTPGSAGSLRLDGSNVQVSFNGIERIVW